MGAPLADDAAPCQDVAGSFRETAIPEVELLEIPPQQQVNVRLGRITDSVAGNVDASDTARQLIQEGPHDEGTLVMIIMLGDIDCLEVLTAHHHAVCETRIRIDLFAGQESHLQIDASLQRRPNVLRLLAIDVIEGQCDRYECMRTEIRLS